MPCFKPLQAAVSRRANVVTGKRHISFHHGDGPDYEAVQLPCGRCRGCRHALAKEWAVRCVHETQLHDENCFITLTFSDKYLNKNGTLVKADFQNFMKRLRKHFFGNQKGDVRYYHCGEYGDRLGRPHHHAILFNLDFSDKKLWKTEKGAQYYRSKTLEMLWPFGHSIIGSASYESAAYVARYCVKKINGKLAPDHYQGRLPEYTTMSRRPGIAAGWYEKYKETDVFPRDFIVLNGVRQKVPKFYSRRYELTNPDEYGEIRAKRIEKAKTNPNNHPDRLKAAEQIQYARDKQLTRSYEAA